MALREQNGALQLFHKMISGAPEMKRFFDQLRRAARSGAPILIRGETGTGKELAAQAIHAESPRRQGPFRAINCATLTPDLLASELFGHVRGAFTGAIRDHAGLFEQAHGGTLFLDEVAELPLQLQARLLRVLQERSFVPVGGSRHIKVDIHLLSATHQSLRERLAEGLFREDLMYRLRVIPLFLPRLRDRHGDIELLSWHFIQRFNQRGHRTIDEIDAATLRRLKSYPWPGNIRELRNVIEYAFAMGEGPVLRCEDLLPDLYAPLPEDREEQERLRILLALREAKGRRAEAAKALGMSRSTLWRRLRSYGL